MRYPSGHKQQSRERIVEAAGTVFRERGVAGSGVDGIMRAAGLTAGAFYAHFASKEALLAEALVAGMGQTRTLLTDGLDHLVGRNWLRAAMARYFSREHRDRVAEGCPLPTLVSELPRAGDATRDAFERELRAMFVDIAARMPAGGGMSAEDRTLATMALSVGGLALARSVQDPALSDRILAACERFAVAELAQDANANDYQRRAS